MLMPATRAGPCTCEQGTCCRARSYTAAFSLPTCMALSTCRAEPTAAARIHAAVWQALFLQTNFLTCPKGFHFAALHDTAKFDSVPASTEPLVYCSRRRPMRDLHTLMEWPLQLRPSSETIPEHHRAGKLH